MVEEPTESEQNAAFLFVAYLLGFAMTALMFIMFIIVFIIWMVIR